MSSKDSISTFFVKHFGKKDDNVTDEIISIVNEGQQQGELLDSEAEMITNIIEFGDKDAQDIMTHRKNLVAIDSQTTIKEAFDFVLDENYSRFPVYEDDLDHIIGIMHLRDLLKIYSDGYKRNHTIYELKNDMLFEPYVVPETKKIDDLFREMQQRKVHMAVVLDEYGQTSGIVTMEDVLEEIVGNIMDEYDEEDSLVVLNDDDSYLMDGYTTLDDIEDLLDIHFEDEDADTLNGFLIARMEHLPENGEEFATTYGGYKFQIVEVEDKRVKKVKVTKEENTD